MKYFGAGKGYCREAEDVFAVWGLVFINYNNTDTS
jgi:hypothetical protein